MDVPSRAYGGPAAASEWLSKIARHCMEGFPVQKQAIVEKINQYEGLPGYYYLCFSSSCKFRKTPKWCINFEWRSGSPFGIRDSKILCNPKIHSHSILLVVSFSLSTNTHLRTHTYTLMNPLLPALAPLVTLAIHRIRAEVMQWLECSIAG